MDEKDDAAAAAPAHTLVDTDDDDDDGDGGGDDNNGTSAAHPTPATKEEQRLPADFTVLTSVAWGPRKGDDGYDTDQTLAPRPKRSRPADPCHCPIPPTGHGCTDESCVVYACREECRSNCALGHTCGNKRMQQQLFKQVELMDAGVKGKGLRLLDDAQPGDILCEYTGQAIREGALERLFRRYALDRRLYILALGDGVYIDARKQGGYARFINHSCQPNCKVERWTVKGISRAAVVALTPIEKGTEMTFDYQWEPKEGRAPTVCHCGARKCRGTLEVVLEDHVASAGDEDAGQQWKRFDKVADETIVNKTIRIKISKNKTMKSDGSDDDGESHERDTTTTSKYLIGEVTGYDDDKKLHCVFYRQSVKEVWEDLDHSKTDWSILNEDNKGNFMIAKKNKAAIERCSKLTVNGDSGPMVVVKSEYPSATAILKNYVYVQTPAKEALFVPMHVERIERSAAVKITAEQMARPPLPPESAEDDEKYAALDLSMDGTVWKIEIKGVDIPKAYGMLEQSVIMIQKRLNYQLHQQQQKQQLESNSAHSTPTEQQEIIFPRAIAEAVQQQVGATVRDRIRNVQVDFAASSSKSKQFSRMTVEGTLLSDVHKANELLWKLLVKLCEDAGLPHSAHCPIHKNLGFYGCELTAQQYNLLVSSSSRGSTSSSRKSITQEFSARDDLLNSSPFIHSLEKAYQCTVWVQSPDDKGRITRKSHLVGQPTPQSPRCVYFGCSPDQVLKLAAVLKGRADDLARGVLYIHLDRTDRVFLKHMVQTKFFDFVSSLTGATVGPDSTCANFLRIDGRRLGEQESHGERDSALLADEIVRLQVECYRDECLRKQLCIFGRDWSLTEVSMVETPNDTAIGALSRKTANQAGKDIADIVEDLELDKSVAGHAVIILYRFVHAKKDFSSRLKLREALLACVFLAVKSQKRSKWTRMGSLLRSAFKVFYNNPDLDTDSKEAAAMAERVIAAEDEILDSIQYDVFWCDGEVLRLFIRENENATGEAVKLALEVAFSAPVLSCGAVLWLNYGLKYIAAACAAFLKAHLDQLVPPLGLQPLKVSETAVLICKTAAFDRVSKKDPTLVQHRKYMEASLPKISQQARDILAKTTAPSAPNALKPPAFARFDIIGHQSSERRVLQGITTELLSESVLPHIESVAADSSCGFQLRPSTTKPNTEEILLEGTWRSIAIAEDQLRQKVPELPESIHSLPAVDIQMAERIKDVPGLLRCSDIRTAGGWKGTPYADSAAPDASGKLGGKCCVPGMIDEDALRHAGLRWWIPPKTGVRQSGSISAMRLLRNADSGDELPALVELARSVAVDPDKFPMLTSVASAQANERRYTPISIQRWPPEKVERKERQPRSKESMLDALMGFSPAALQEMNVLRLLHQEVPSSKGHPNFVTPVGVALVESPQSSSSVDKTNNEDRADTSSVYSLNLSNDENAIVADTEKGVGACSHVVLPPTPFILQNLRPRRLNTPIPDSVLAAWVYDCLSILVHCHTNNILIRHLNLDNVVVDHCGVLKLGALYRYTVISDTDRPRERKLEQKHKERLNRMNVDQDDAPEQESQKQEKDVVERRAEIARRAAKKELRLRLKGKKSKETFVLYDAPEILLGDQKHTKTCDVWSMGCLFLDLILRKPLFDARDRGELLLSIFKVLGAPKYNYFPEGMELPYYKKPERRYRRGLEKHLRSILGHEGVSVNDKLIDLILRMLYLDPADRCTATEAMGHEYIADYLENSQSKSFREQFVNDWGKMKEAALVYCQSRNAEGTRKKRLAVAVAKGSEGKGMDDDLYDFDDIFEASPGGPGKPKKKRTLG